MKKDKSCPIVKCFVSSSGRTVKFWCPYCQKWHIHGSYEGGNWEGHRVAHCYEETPFSDTGYILKACTKKELAEIAECTKR